MSPFNKIAIAIAIALFAILMIWPLLQQDGIEANSKHSVLTEDYLGDGSSPIIPIPLSMDLDQGKIELGEQLFNDPILSSNGFSCASCHPLSSAGMDGLKLSLTSSGGSDQMNTPTIFNSGFNALQLWNGKVDTLEQQTHNVIHNPQHMNASWPRILDRLQLNPHYLKQFNALYADGLNSDNIINAIVTFERSLITPNADFDQYLRGNMEAITNDQKKGYRLFQDYGCISCHQGINVGGNLLARFGIFESQSLSKKELTDYDYGRYAYSRQPQDKFVFRVPSLRNVALTAPYFHDGSAASLADAITTMAQVQLDIELPEYEVKLIASFLSSLTGEYRGKKL